MLVVHTRGARSGFEWLLLLLITVSCCSERLPPAVLDFSKGVVHGVGILCLLLVVVVVVFVVLFLLLRPLRLFFFLLLILVVVVVLLLLVVCMMCVRYDSRLLHLVVVW
jgi:hypothetical protein